MGTMMMYDEGVPICIRTAGREDKCANVRVCVSVAAKGSQKELRVRLTEGGEAFFLYVLVVAESGYQALRDEQGLLVDFASFPDDLVRLFDAVRATWSRAAAGGEAAAGNFLVYLDVGAGADGTAVLQIVETNQLRNLPHLSLRLRAGDDAAVKEYLDAELTETRALATTLHADLGELEGRYAADVGALQAAKAELSEKLLVAAAEADAAVAAAELAAAKAVDAATASGRRQTDNVRAELSGKLEAVRREAERAAAAAAREAAEARDRIDTLVDANTRLETQVSVLGENLEAARAELAATKGALADARGSNVELDSTKHAQLLSINEARMRIAALEQQVADKDETIGKMEALMAEGRSSRAALDETLAMYKADKAKLEADFGAAAGEVTKANEIIRKLQADIVSLRSRVKMKNAIMVRQEGELAAAQGDAAKAGRALDDYRTQLSEKDAQLARAKSRVGELVAGLDEARAKIVEQTQTIEFLHKRLNEKEIGDRNPFAGLAGSMAQKPLGPIAVPHSSVVVPRPAPAARDPSSAYTVRPSYFDSGRLPLSAMPLPANVGASGPNAPAAGDAAPAIFSNTTARFADSGSGPGVVKYEPKAKN